MAIIFRVLFLFALVNVFSITFGQQKPDIAETKNWILQKLNAYKQNIVNPGVTISTPFGHRNLTSADKDFSFSFNNFNLLIQYYIGEGEHKTLQQVTVPICNANLYGNSTFGGESHFTNCGFYSPHKNIINSYGYISDFAFNIDFDREQDLFERIKKAFENLKSYCLVSTTKETF